jgi:hypothetical protein
MKKLLSLLTLLIFFSINHESKISAQIIVIKIPSPPSVIISKPSTPKDEHLWVDGHWHYDKKISKHVWKKGYWKKHNEGHYWSAGRWVACEGGYHWLEGKWVKGKKPHHDHKDKHHHDHKDKHHHDHKDKHHKDKHHHDKKGKGKH